MQDGEGKAAIVRWHASKMQAALDQNEAEAAFHQAYSVFTQLRTTTLASRDYYELFTSVFDESRRLESWLAVQQESLLREWYVRVQYCYAVLPRLYLMVTIGAICIRGGMSNAADMPFDLLNMVKGVQHPLRGLFLRYYLNKSLKEAFTQPNCLSVIDSVRFFIENLAEMHQLWSRLSSPNDLPQAKTDLCVLLGENITRLSQLSTVTLPLYQDTVFPQLLAAVMNARDEVSQSYLIDGVIHTFPDEYHTFTLGALLTTVEKYGKTDKLKLADGLLDRLLLYAQSETGKRNLIDTEADVIMKGFTETAILSTEVTEMRALTLIEKLLMLLILLRPEDFSLPNEVLVTVSTKITMSERAISLPAEQTLTSVLRLMLEKGNHRVFTMTSFRKLMTYLGPERRAEVSLKVVKVIIDARRRLESADLPLILSLSENIICYFPSTDLSARLGAFVTLAKLLHGFAALPSELKRLIAQIRPLFAAVPEAILALAPTLIFLLSQNLISSSQSSDFYLILDQLLDFVYIKDHDFAVKLATLVTLMRSSDQFPSIIARLLRQWMEEPFYTVHIDTLLSVIGALEAGSRKGMRLGEEWTLCWEIVRELGSKGEQMRGLCALARLQVGNLPISLPCLLTNMLKTADMSSTFDLIQVLNVFLSLISNSAANLSMPALSHLISLLLLQTHTKRDQVYLASTLSFIRSLQQRHHLAGLSWS